MIKQLSTLAAILILTTAADAQVKPAGYETIIPKLAAAIRHEVAVKDLPAFSIAIIENDHVMWSGDYGLVDDEQRERTNNETIYRVGSVSKLFTDIAVMQLVEQGELDLDVPVQDYVPYFAQKNPYGTPITLRMLMSHMSGLVREPPVGHYFDPDEPSLRATVESLNRTTLVYEPNTRTKYSNAGIAVVGAVLEEKLGQPFSLRVAESILKPLEMNNSSFELTPNVRERLASAQMWTYDGRRFEASTFLLGTAPAGNMYSTVGDLSSFLIAIFDDGRGTSGRILKPETLQQMLTPQPGPDGKPTSFGIGFHVEKLDGHTKIGHGGAVYGFSTQLEALPDHKLGVVAVSALDGSNGVVGRIADYALRLMLANREQTPWPEYERTGEVPASRAKELPGSFRDGERLTHVTELNGRVYAQRGSFRYEVRSSNKDGSLVLDDPIGFGTRLKLDDDNNLVVRDTTFVRLSNEAPAETPTRWKGLIGEYGWDHNTLYILEDRGRLVALIEWFYYYPLTEIDENTFAFPDYGLYHGEKLHFTRGDDGIASEVNAAEVVFRRREVGTKDGETFRITPVKPIDELRAGALAASPPDEADEFREADLVELTSLDPTIKLDIRYASTNNFTGAVFYKQPRAFMQRPAAEAVVRVHQKLKRRGLGLLIHDAYRPWHVTKMFWDATPDELKDFVANPANGSRHNRGCAVDLTLYDLETGDPIPMVAGYDEFSPRSFPMYPGGTSRQRWYREELRRAMEAEGFTIYEYEWWHFDYKDWKKYRIGNVTFEDLLKTGAAIQSAPSSALRAPSPPRRGRREGSSAESESESEEELTYTIERSAIHSGYDGESCWVHARAGAIPAAHTMDELDDPLVVMTTQKLLLTGSDVFYALNGTRTETMGTSWSNLNQHDGFARKTIDERTEMTVCDFVPQWHAGTKTLLGTGQTVWYRDNAVMHVRPRATAYAVYNQKNQEWSQWQELEMPDELKFRSSGAGSVQRYDLPNGDILLPVYFKEPAAKQYSVAVCRCTFDGHQLEYVEHGNELTIDVDRGLYEPSVTKFGNRFYLTMRNDQHGYVSTSEDGLEYSKPKQWTFDDGSDLGNYNTQQHWVTHSDALFLVYTRKGADNDHVFRHRAPLFIAQMDPKRLVVRRETEQILVPERGARLGNFGVVDVTPDETWITVTEWMQTWGPDHIIKPDNPRGADNSIFVAKLKWDRPNRLISP